MRQNENYVKQKLVLKSIDIIKEVLQKYIDLDKRKIITVIKCNPKIGE